MDSVIDIGSEGMYNKNLKCCTPEIKSESSFDWTLIMVGD